MPVFQNYEPQVTPDIGQVQRVSTNGEAIGQGISNLGAGLQDAGIGLLRYQKHVEQTNDFDDQAKLRNFIQVRQNALDVAKQNMPAEATGFAGNFMKDQQASEQKFLETISPANRARYAASIQATNSNFLGLATEAERAGRSSFETNNVQQAYNGYLNTVRGNPSAREAAQTDLFKSIDAMTSATPEQKIEMKQKIDNGMAFQQALGEAGNDPTKMKTMVWGKQAALPSGSAPGASGRGLNNGVYNRPLNQPGASGASPMAMYSYLKSQGASDNEALVLTSAAASESSFNDKAVHDGGSGYGMFGHNLKRLDMRGKDWQQQASSALQELRSRPESKLVNSATNAADLATAQMHFEQPAGYSRGNPRAGDNYTGRFNTIRYFSQLQAGPHGLPPYAEAGYDQAANGGQSSDQPTSAGPPTSIAPDSRFASLTPEQRDSLVETATRNLTAQTTAANTAAAQAQKSLVDNLQTAIINNQAGLADVKPFLDRKQITPDQYLQLQGQIEKRDGDTASASNFLASMQAGEPMNRFDTKTQDGADAGFRAMGGTLDAFDTIYQKTGIVPKSAATQLQAAIFGTNVSTAAKALQIGANVMTGNANAFKGVTGGDDIQKAVGQYNHFIGTGDTTDAAVRKVMQLNDPNYKPTVKVTDSDLKTFQDNITTSSVAGMFDQHPLIPFVGNPQVGSDPQQQSEILADFKQIATDFYQQSGDQKLALSQAKDQLSRVYGVTNAFGTATLTKYPPEKSYPALQNDTNGGYGYISRQAVDAIKEATGHDVDPANVTLLPIPGTTQAAFAVGRPVPYQLAYTWTRPDGQQQHDVIYGKGFIADPAAAQKQLQDAARPGFEAYDAWRQSELQKDEAARQQLKDLYGGILTTNTQPTQVEIDENARASANTAKAKGIDVPPPPKPAGGVPTSGSDAFNKAKQQFTPEDAAGAAAIYPGGL